MKQVSKNNKFQSLKKYGIVKNLVNGKSCFYTNTDSFLMSFIDFQWGRIFAKRSL